MICVLCDQIPFRHRSRKGLRISFEHCRAGLRRGDFTLVRYQSIGKRLLERNSRPCACRQGSLPGRFRAVALITRRVRATVAITFQVIRPLKQQLAQRIEATLFEIIEVVADVRGVKRFVLVHVIILDAPGCRIEIRPTRLDL